jgi:hypothetical protein
MYFYMLITILSTSYDDYLISILFLFLLSGTYYLWFLLIFLVSFFRLFETGFNFALSLFCSLAIFFCSATLDFLTFSFHCLSSAHPPDRQFFFVQVCVSRLIFALL